MDPQAIKSHLTDHPWGDLLVYRERIGSTNDLAKALGQGGAASGTVVLADMQTAGRGRMGRSFASPPEGGIYLSLLLRPTLRGEDLRTLTPRAAVCVRRAMGETCGVLPQIKWVNDLLLEGKKLCGILTELSFSGPDPAFAVIGIGINCNTPAEAFPPEVRPIAGSVKSVTGQAVDREALAAGLIRELSALETLDWYEEYRSACLTLGRTVLLPDGREARATDLGPRGELEVQLPGGEIQTFAAGEVTLKTEL